MTSATRAASDRNVPRHRAPAAHAEIEWSRPEAYAQARSRGRMTGRNIGEQYVIQSGSMTIDFLDDLLVDRLETSLRTALGESVLLDLQIDENAWTVQGDPRLLEDVLVGLAWDAREAMGADGVLHVCVLNIHDRCGGTNDGILLALSDGASAIAPPETPSSTQMSSGQKISAVARPGVSRAHAFAELCAAEFGIATGRRCGTTISLIFPRWIES